MAARRSSVSHDLGNPLDPAPSPPSRPSGKPLPVGSSTYPRRSNLGSALLSLSARSATSCLAPTTRVRTGRPRDFPKWQPTHAIPHRPPISTPPPPPQPLPTTP